MAEKEESYVVSEDVFRTPTMGDYYIGAIDDVYCRKIDEILHKKNSGEGNAKNAAFYTETPPMEEFGYKDGIYYIKARINVSEEDMEDGNFNGHQICVDIRDCTGNDEAVGKLKAQLNTIEAEDCLANKANTFNLRLLGLSCMETSEWAHEINVPEDSFVIRKNVPVKDIAESDEYVYDRDSGASTEKDFVRIGNKWRECQIGSSSERGYISFRWLINYELRGKEGKKTAQKLKSIIEAVGNGDIYLVIDEEPIRKGSELARVGVHELYSDSLVMRSLSAAFLRSSAPDEVNCGYSKISRNANRRFQGKAYIKADGKFINLSKAVLCEPDAGDVHPETVCEGKHTELFGLKDETADTKAWADAYFEAAESFDDRDEIQRKIWGKSIRELEEFTVTLGDVTFFVPPANITSSEELENEQIPVVRARGSAMKSSTRIKKKLFLEIYFNEERGINGYPVEIKLPNGSRITHYMNGLRALVAQFKFTPFLPVQNNYINRVLGIEAVVMDSLSVRNVEGFPKLYQANLVLSEFTANAYMPELYALFSNFPEDDKTPPNIFATAFNWPVMRFYYQSCIRRGNNLAELGYKYNSEGWNKAMRGNKTALYPMTFEKSVLDFYMLDAAYLAELQKVRLSLEGGTAGNVPVLSGEEVAAMKSIGRIGKAVEDVVAETNICERMARIYQQDGSMYQLFKNAVEHGSGLGGDLSDWEVTGLENASGEITGEVIRQKWMTSANEKEINACLGLLKERLIRTENAAVRAVKLRYQPDIKENENGSKEYALRIGVVVLLDIDNQGEKEILGKIREDLISIGELKSGEWLSNGEIFIPFMVNGANPGFVLDTDYPEFKFLRVCERADDIRKNVEEIKEMHSLANMARLDAGKYNLVNLGGPVYIESFSAGLSNHTSNVKIQNYSGTSAQYMGGENTIFSMLIKTTSNEVVKNLASLSDTAAKYARDFHHILPCCPLRVDSEITRFFGVNEILLDNVKIETGNNETGVYTINLLFHSVDRTVRDREALERIELDNAVLDARSKKLQGYFDINKVIGKAELYPDLELPTIENMKKAGYDFLRYKFQDDRVYVDPDFYFIYPYNLNSSLTREMCISGIKNGWGKVELTDQAGASATLVPVETCGFKVAEMNDRAKEQEEGDRNAKKAAQSLKGRKQTENISRNAIPVASGIKSWRICENIETALLEPEYCRIYQEYRHNKNAEAALSNVGEVAEKKAQETVTAETYPKSEHEGEDGKTDTANWVNIRLGKAREASEAIKAYLENPIECRIIASSRKTIKADIRNQTERMLKDERIAGILRSLNCVVEKENFRETVKNIVYAAACAATGNKECASLNSSDWEPDGRFIGIISEQGTDGDLAATDALDKVLSEGISFGVFNLRLVSADRIRALFGETMAERPKGEITEVAAGSGEEVIRSKESVKVSKEKAASSWVNGHYYPIDPYYRICTMDEFLNYKIGCSRNTEFATTAFFRIVLYWLKFLIDRQILPSMSSDVLREAALNEVKIRKAQEEKGVADKVESGEAFKKSFEFFERRRYAFDSGKVWAAVVLAITNGDSQFLSAYRDRDYKALECYTRACTMQKTDFRKAGKSPLLLRKLIFALVGLRVIKDVSLVGIPTENPVSEHLKRKLEKKFIEAAEDPQQFIPHSCHDMITYDARGRMLRAFPTFYMVFIDEGRRIGLWKLHDNFYNTTAIAGIQIVKSRKMAADTANITMSNFYRTYTTENEDYQKVAEAGIGDVLDSVFSPEKQAEKEEQRRLDAVPEARLRIRPGTRIHIRMGYGSNAAMLPVVFNGNIAEVSAEEVVHIVAQGDGIELLNPITDHEQGHEILYEDSNPLSRREKHWLGTNGGTPKEILCGFLTTRGGWLKKLAKNSGNSILGSVLNYNPYGIYHFGNPDFSVLHKTGEPVQNIFEACPKPAWGNNSVTYEYALNAVPEISIDVFRKNIWEIANICRSVSPDHICAVAPFSFRSTLFVGAPRFYYAYDYWRDEAQNIFEKRKPFEQYHIINSYSDIIANGIAATTRDMKTVAIGLYQRDAFAGGTSQERLDPIYANWDIFPEEQKTMIVNTNYIGKYAQGTAHLFGDVFGLRTLADEAFDEEGSLVSFKKIAWRMTASALRESMMDMYCGDIVIVGDASVKPWDRIYISDSFEGFTGQVTAKEVVLDFSVENGFITTISPDCIVKVDDPFEPVVNGVMERWGSIATAVAATTVMAGGLSLVRNITPVSYLGKFLENKVMGSAAAGHYLRGKNWLRSEGIEYLEKAMGKIEKGWYRGMNLPAKMKKVIRLGKGVWGAGTAAVAAMAASGTAAGAAAGIIGVLAPYLAVLGSTYMMAGALNGYLARMLKSLRAVTVYPLERHFLPYTAGIDGSTGLIMSRHAVNIPSVLDTVVGEAAGSSGKDGLLRALWSGVIGVLADEDFLDAVKKFQAKTAMRDEDGKPKTDNRIYRNSTDYYLSKTEGLSDYRSIELSPRADFNSVDFVEAREYFRIEDTEKWKVNPKLQEMKIIGEDRRFIPYLEDGFFVIIHDNPDLAAEGLVSGETIITPSGENRYVKAIKGKNSEGTEYYDIPMLHADAVNVLLEIVRRTRNKMMPVSSDKAREERESIKKSRLILKSALRIGEGRSLSNTGFAFILQPLNMAEDAMNAAVKEIQDEMLQDKAGGITKLENLFLTKREENGEVSFVVPLPKLSAEGKKNEGLQKDIN